MADRRAYANGLTIEVVNACFRFKTSIAFASDRITFPLHAQNNGMKKLLCIVMGLLCLMPSAGCRKKAQAAPRLWCVQPSTVTAEEDVRKMVREYDAEAFISFIPADEIGTRLSQAFEKDDAPDVFMLYSDAIANLAEDKKLLDISQRLPLSNVQQDELRDNARRACLYQGKTWGVPLFSDAYMLACNRALVSVPPETGAQLSALQEQLKAQDIALFEKTTPEKQSLLFEALLKEHSGAMFNARKTKLTFADEHGCAALDECAALLNDTAERDTMGAGKAAFSIMTTAERQAYAQKFPDAEISLSPLFGLDRLQTVAIAVNAKTKDQKRAFGLLEFLQQKTDTLSALYKTYSAKKDITPLSSQDRDAVVRISEARPAPDLCGYAALVQTHLPAAIDKAQKGVPAADALTEAAKNASDAIWVGKRE